ncbi:hypothetical protein GH714_011907 [Hevea brasiliensis]|uniref:Uncharacterized protein n=1 Tax=Hevea brasiliensis TaxID=3981 RepID=A0A6A6K7W7_HEVBR|nr:hypothetical protein GH714_011907 [Hevea brasiliensis]
MAFKTITGSFLAPPTFHLNNSLLRLALPANQQPPNLTILAVSNDAVGSLSGKTPRSHQEDLGRPCGSDYYDQTKLKNLEKKSSILTTFRVIEAPGIDNIAPSPPPGAPEKAPAPAPTKAKSPAPVAEEPVADNAPIEAPTEAPTPADAPEANAPISSPPEPNSTPADDATAPAVPPSQESVSSRMHAGGIVAVIGLLARPSQAVSCPMELTSVNLYRYVPETSKMLNIWAYASLPNRGRLTLGPWPRGPRCRTGLELCPVTMWYQSKAQTIRIMPSAPTDRGRQGTDGDKGVAEIGLGRMSGLNGTEVDMGFSIPHRTRKGRSEGQVRPIMQHLASNMMNLGKGILEDVCVRKWVSALAN